MQWELSARVEDYVENALELLESEPALNTIALTILGQVRSGRRFSDVPPVFGWSQVEGRTVGAVFLTPPFELGLAVVPLDSVPALVEALLAAGVTVPGVIGNPVACDAFVERWPDAPPRDRLGGQRQRLYRLDRLIQPEPLPTGAARAARAADFDTLLSWTHAFHAEAGTRSTPGDADGVRSRSAAGLLWVWETDAGLVSMSGRQATAVKVARIGPVYTPPDHRRHGYGAAVTAACTADALAKDADSAVLFTDLANPTSNAIYQTIGYQPVEDRVVYRFEELPVI